MRETSYLCEPQNLLLEGRALFFIAISLCIMRTANVKFNLISRKVRP